MIPASTGPEGKIGGEWTCASPWWSGGHRGGQAENRGAVLSTGFTCSQETKQRPAEESGAHGTAEQAALHLCSGLGPPRKSWVLSLTFPDRKDILWCHCPVVLPLQASLGPVVPTHGTPSSSCRARGLSKGRSFCDEAVASLTALPSAPRLPHRPLSLLPTYCCSAPFWNSQTCPSAES